MKNNNTINFRFMFLLSVAFTLVIGCEREFSDDVEFAEFPPNGDVFIDTFSAGLDYFPFVDAGADPEAFSVETEEVYAGDAAMRFDVPAFGNGFVGATFNTTARRDLSGFDALTFYAKASKAASINSIGYGISGETNNKFQVTANNLNVSTRWEKYIIPIPDATRLISETGLFWLAEGASFEGDEGGYILWLDEIKFEKLGTVAQPKPAIFEGEDTTEQAFIGSSLTIGGLTQTFDLGDGTNQTVSIAPSYFNFESSDIGVATVNELGQVIVLGEGNVKSIFSDAYVNDTESNFSPGFGGSTTETAITTTNDGEVVTYANNNFTGIIFDNTVDASGLTFMHIDVYVQQDGTEIGLQIRDVGANQTIDTDVNTGFPIGDDKDLRVDLTGLTVGQWTSFDIPLDGDLATQKNNLGALILVGGPNFILDNIYFYTE